MRELKTLPRWQAVLLLYLWSVPCLIVTLQLFDLPFEYYGDLLSWVIAVYIFPVEAIKEMFGTEFSIALIFYILTLAVACAWLFPGTRNSDQADYRRDRNERLKLGKRDP